VDKTVGKWKFNSISALVKWIVQPEILQQVEIPEESSAPTGMRSRFAEGGFLRWLFTAETLEQEPESSRPVPRWGNKSFLRWLFSADELEERPAMEKRSSRFGEAGFFHWLVNSEKIDEEKADQEPAGKSR